MKIKLPSCKTLPIGISCKNNNRISIQGILKSAFTLLALFISISVGAQKVQPATNISGPLKAKVNGSNITVTVEMVTDVNPVINYSFGHNSSGATIVSKGTLNYDNNTGIGTQTIVVNPGANKGSFNIKAEVISTGGTAEASKSVTVLK